MGTARRRTSDLMGYFVTTVKSSNCVTESAFVHTPTLPGVENVASSTSVQLTAVEVDLEQAAVGDDPQRAPLVRGHLDSSCRTSVLRP